MVTSSPVLSQIRVSEMKPASARPGPSPFPRQGRGEENLRLHLGNCKYDIIRDVGTRLGYVIVTDEDEDQDYDLCWSDCSVSLERVHKLKSYQRINHFSGMLEICRKHNLSRHMRRLAQQLPREYCFYPKSLLLPEQLDELSALLRRNAPTSPTAATAGPPPPPAAATTFIIKPSAGTMGRGITLAQRLGDLQHINASNAVAQQYVSNPLLLDGGYKFDLRVYALVLSANPLVLHVHEEGLARLATQPYFPPDADNLKCATMHLTNYSVNKHAPGFVTPADPAAPAGVAAAATTATCGGGSSGAGTSAAAGGNGPQHGSKQLMSSVLDRVAVQRGTSRQALWDSIADVVFKTVASIQPLLAHTYEQAVGSKNRYEPYSWENDHHRHHQEQQSGDGGDDRGRPSSSGSGGAGGSGSGGGSSSSSSSSSSQCFEVLGFDILFDSDLKPWLLEVNHSPSFSCDAAIDVAVKSAVVNDAITALGQTRAAREEFRLREARALSERLYSGATSVSAITARPLSAMKRSSLLLAASQRMAQAPLLDVAGSGSGGSSSAGPSPPISPTGCSGGEHYRASNQLAASSSPSAAAYGTNTSTAAAGVGRAGAAATTATGNGSRQHAAPHMGRFVQVYPAPDPARQRRYDAILEAACDAFPVQRRCQCAWCMRRRSVLLMRESLVGRLAAQQQQQQQQQQPGSCTHHQQRPFSAPTPPPNGAQLLNALLPDGLLSKALQPASPPSSASAKGSGAPSSKSNPYLLGASPSTLRQLRKTLSDVSGSSVGDADGATAADAGRSARGSTTALTRSEGSPVACGSLPGRSDDGAGGRGGPHPSPGVPSPRALPGASADVAAGSGVSGFSGSGAATAVAEDGQPAAVAVPRVAYLSRPRSVNKFAMSELERSLASMRLSSIYRPATPAHSIAASRRLGVASASGKSGGVGGSGSRAIGSSRA